MHCGCVCPSQSVIVCSAKETGVALQISIRTTNKAVRESSPCSGRSFSMALSLSRDFISPPGIPATHADKSRRCEGGDFIMFAGSLASRAESTLAQPAMQSIIVRPYVRLNFLLAGAAGSTETVILLAKVKLLQYTRYSLKIYPPSTVVHAAGCFCAAKVRTVCHSSIQHACTEDRCDYQCALSACRVFVSRSVTSLKSSLSKSYRSSVSTAL